MNTIVKNTLILTIITLISGLLLGFVYQITKEPIAASEEKTKKDAYKAVMLDAAEFSEMDYDADSAKNILIENGLEADVDVTGLICAYGSDNKAMGYVITVQSHEGYGGDIDVTVGILNDGTVAGVEITSIAETAGLGMRANTPEFKAQFKDKNVDLFAYSKSGASNDNEIDALSGATITTNAMTNAVNAAVIYSKNVERGDIADAE